MTVGEAGEALRLVSRTTALLEQTLQVEADGKAHSVNLPLIGAYQAANSLVAAALVIATGADVAQPLGDLARVQPVRGRLARAALTQPGAPSSGDFAHTPDGLRDRKTTRLNY